MQLDIATYSVHLVWPCTVTCFTAFICSLQKLNSIGGKCMFVGMFKFHLSFYTMAVKGIVMGCDSRPNHRHHYLERVFAATTLDTTMTYFTK